MTTAPNAPSDWSLCPWMDIAAREVGTQEIAGKGANPRIVEYLKTTTLPASMASSDETSWCSAWCCWVLQQAGYAHTHSAAARSYTTYGNASPLKPGAIVVFSRDSAGPSAGHVGFCVEVPARGSQLRVLSGNTANRVAVSLEPAAKLLAVRWPVKAIASPHHDPAA